MVLFSDFFYFFFKERGWGVGWGLALEILALSLIEELIKIQINGELKFKEESKKFKSLQRNLKIFENTIFQRSLKDLCYFFIVINKIKSL